MLPTFCFLNDSKMYVLILEDSPSKTHSLKQKSPSVSLCAEDITASLQNRKQQLLGKHWITSTLLALLVQPSNAVCIYAETSPSELFTWSFLYSCGHSCLCALLFISRFKLDLKLLVLLAPCLNSFSSTIPAQNPCQPGRGGLLWQCSMVMS